MLASVIVIGVLCASSLLAVASAAMQLVDTGARLPSTLVAHRAVYDGQDSIYVVGGFNASISYNTKVFKYSLVSGEVEIIGEFVPRSHATITMFGDDIISVGGYLPDQSHSSDVHRISTVPGNYSYTLVNNLPVGVGGMAIASDLKNNISYLISGYADHGVAMDRIFRYDSLNDEITQVVRPVRPREGAAAVWDTRREVAYIFGGSPTKRKIWRYDPATGVVAALSARLAVDTVYPCAEFLQDSDMAYIILGPTVMSFNATDQTSRTVEVDNKWPQILQGMGCAYVPKLGRLYILGGWAELWDEFGGKQRDEIFFVQVTAV